MSVSTDKAGRHTVEFRLRGRRIHRRCPKGTTKAEAEALEAKIRHDIFEARDLGVIPDVSLEAAIHLWIKERVLGSKSELSRLRHARALADFVSGKTLRDIPAVADAYRSQASPVKSGRKALTVATINRRLSVLKAVAKFAWRKKWIRENLSPHVWTTREHNARHVYLTAVTARRLAAMAPTPEGRAWIALACATGLRRAELYGVGKVGGGSVRRGVIYFGVDTKTGEPRAVPIAGPGKPYVKHFPFTRSLGSLEWEWRQARAAAGYGPHTLRFHDLRHTFASLLINEGVDLYTVGKLLGHKTMQTTRRYAHLDIRTLKRAVAKL